MNFRLLLLVFKYKAFVYLWLLFVRTVIWLLHTLYLAVTYLHCSVLFEMAQNPSTSIDYGASLDKRLLELDDVDRKIADLMETTKEIIGNLEKDKQVSILSQLFIYVKI